MARRSRPIRYAVIGLGHFAQTAVLPAFERLRNAQLTALASGDAVKLRRLGKQYDVEHCVDYSELDQLFSGRSVDAVYIATPNALHAAHAIRAARAGVHVLCEKPLAVSERECAAIVAAAREHDVKLMVAYRLHFEAANLAAIAAVRKGRIGEPRCFNAVFTMQVRAGNSRLDAGLGGGPLRDIGIYCVNAARYLFGEEPNAVGAIFGKPPGDARFDQVDEQVAAMLRFPEGRVATFIAGFGAARVASCELIGTKASLRLDPAFHHAEALTLELRTKRRRKRTYPKRDQVAAEVAYFSECVLRNREPEPSGIEGMADVRILEALELSRQHGGLVAIEPMHDPKAPEPSQARYVPPHPAPSLVHSAQPSR
jgi:predicted dehydrogenase